MDSAILSLLGAFLLSIIGLFVFIWSMRKGLLMENCGFAGQCIRFLVPLCATDEQLAAGFDIFEQCLRENL